MVDLAGKPADTQKTAYFIGGGATMMYGVDAESAVRQFPHEWRFVPWPVEDVNAYRQAQYQAQVEQAQRDGKPVPPEPPELSMSQEDQAALDEDAQRRREAAETVAEDDRRRAEAAAWDAKVVAARAVLNAPAPQPGTVARPLSAVPEAERSRVVIPENWQNEGVQKRRTIAIRLGAPLSVKGDEANPYIEAELKRRATASDETKALAAKPAIAAQPADLTDADRDKVEIADDWRDQSGPKRRSIAVNLGAPKTVTTEQADQVIEAELKRRADATKLT